MRVLHYPTTVDLTLHSSHPAAHPAALVRPNLPPQEPLPRPEHRTPFQPVAVSTSDNMNWMDELEHHIVQSLTEEDEDEPRSPRPTSDDSSSEDEDEEMDVIDLTPLKPPLPIRIESISVPTFSPPSPPPSSPEFEDVEDEDGAGEDEDEDMADAYNPTYFSPAFAAGRHHGYSRSALHNLKEFWSCRHDEWIKINAYSASRAYDGIIKSPRPSLRLDTTFLPSNNPSMPTLSPSSTLSEDSQASSVHTPSPLLDPNAPIFPRVGDIARLRDPRTAIIDRAFCHVPLHSISKMVYIHEVSRAVSPCFDDCTPDASTMSVYSDDSTLVEEELSPERKGVSTGNSVDWFERWKVIAEKVGGRLQDDGTLVDKAFLAPLSEEGLSWADEVQRAESRPQSPAGRKFFFALDDDDFSDRDFDDDDDDDDYGVELAKSKSSFSSKSSGYGWEREGVSDFEMLF